MNGHREAGQRMATEAAQRLRSWKEIATFLGADERTVRRWEERGLPVRRIPGSARSAVYAHVDEIEAWLNGRGAATSPAEAHPPGRMRGRRLVFLAAALALLSLAGAAAILFRPGSADPALAHRPPPHAVELYSAATYNWERRSPESLKRAVSLFGAAIAEDPDYAEAYVGLANSYLLLREFSVMPQDLAYTRARQAARRALAIDPGLAGAHAALGFATFFGSRDQKGGLRSLKRATELDPGSATAYHWYATALLTMGRSRDALAAIEQAEHLGPAAPSILSDKALILYTNGRTRDALFLLGQVEANEPAFFSAHSYIAIIDLDEGRNADYLREAAAAANLRRDPDRLAEVRAAARGHADGGRIGMLRALADIRTRQQAEGRGSYYGIAQVHALLGARDQAVRALAEAARAGEVAVFAAREDPAFRAIRSDPDFARAVPALS